MLWVLAAALQVGGLAATASVTAVVALGAASLLALLVWKRSRITLAVALAGLLLLLAAVALQRGALLDPRDPASPSRQRVANWHSAWQVALDHPWLGVGPGAFAEASLAKRQPGDNEARHAHDLPLELAAEIGWPGAVLASGAFFALFLVPLWREQSGEPWRRAAAIGLASFALHNLADFTFVMPSILWTAAILRGLLMRPGGPDAGPPWLRATALGAMIAAALAASLGGLGRESRLAARAASHAGDHGLALALATRALTLAPWDIDSAVAVAAASAEEPAVLALERAERAVRMAPTRGAARELRARARLAAGDPAGALADWERASQLDPQRAEVARAKDAVRRALRVAYR
jgi:tetratricopeptide (TPR) repeat protein